MLETPVLIINFNRPDFTQKVMGVVMEQSPKELYLFQDGPRVGRNDEPRLEEVRNIIKDATAGTNSHVHTYFSDTNLGCGPGPAAALSWFFSNVEAGIIIEDDAVPHPDFFPYATQLLERYRNDDSVKAIGSMNVDKQQWGDGSYYFSMMNRNLCAWASWRRAWQFFDIRLPKTSRRDLSIALRNYGCGLLEREYWCDRLDEVHKDGIDNSSWDMQFFMSIWLQHGKGIIPNSNLSSNIGTIVEATHPLGSGNIIDNIPTKPILPLIHPSSEEIVGEADRQFHFLYFQPGRSKWKKKDIYKYLINNRLKKILGHKGPWRKRR
jgi:hypothetical protein